MENLYFILKATIWSRTSSFTEISGHAPSFDLVDFALLQNTDFEIINNLDITKHEFIL